MAEIPEKPIPPNNPPRLKQPEDYYIRKLLLKVPLSDVMTTPVATVRADAPFREVVRTMNDHRVRHIPIVDGHGRLAGLITQRDVYRIQSPRKLEDGRWYYDEAELDAVILSRVMNDKPFTLPPQARLAEALEKMVQFKYGCVPVTDDHRKVVGIVTQYDFLKLAVAILHEGDSERKK